MPVSPTRIHRIAFVPRIGSRRRVASLQHIGHLVEIDLAREAAVADSQIFVIPTRRRQPHLEPDIRICRGLNHSGHTAESRQTLDRIAIRGGELTWRNHLRGQRRVR